MSPVSQLNPNKVSLTVPNKLVSVAHEPLAMPFTELYSESVALGVVPEVLKISRVTPSHKSSGLMSDVGNYRPISTLSPFSKVFEQLVYDQLVAFIEKENILYQFQFGFRKGFFTEQAIIEITDYVKSSIDNHLYTCGMFLEFSKGLDTVNHSILLRKLEKYGIRGLPLELFHSYLSNRTQYVQIGNIKSASLTIRCGITQGSTIGPLLFLFYVLNDLPDSANALQFRIFADDANKCYSSKKS